MNPRGGRHRKGIIWVCLSETTLMGQCCLEIHVISRTPRLRRTNWCMHSTDIKYAKSTGHPLRRILVDNRPRNGRVWLWIALVGRVVGGLVGVGVWPKLRVVRRECRGIGVPVVRMIGEMFAAVELQKIGRVHEGEYGGGGGDESRGERAVFDCVVDGERGSAQSETATVICVTVSVKDLIP